MKLIWDQKECPTKICCHAMEASCEACKAGMNMEDWCEMNIGYEGCPKKGCPSQEDIDKLPAMSAKTVCEDAGCKYSTDTTDPFKTKRMCKKDDGGMNVIDMCKDGCEAGVCC